MNDPVSIGVELAKPLQQKHVRPARQFGPKGDYLEGWHVIAEANRIFGWDGWSYTVVERALVAEAPREIGKDDRKKPGWGVSYVARIRVTVGAVTREDEGAGHGYDVDKGMAHESAIKEAVTDALKRALRTFGNPFGLALYDKSRENVSDEPENRAPAKPPLSQQAAPSGPRQEPARTPQVTPVHSLDKFDADMSKAVSMDDLAAIWDKWSDLHRTPGAAKIKDRHKARISGTPFDEPIAATMIRTGTFGG